MPGMRSTYTGAPSQQLAQAPFNFLTDYSNGTPTASQFSNASHRDLEASGLIANHVVTGSNHSPACPHYPVPSGDMPAPPLVWATDGTLQAPPRQELLDNVSLLSTKPANKPYETPLEKLEHAYIEHTPENQELISKLSQPEQTIVKVDGGNTVEAQLMVYRIIMQYPPDAENMRVWRKVVTVTPSGRKVEYFCNGVNDKGVRCDHKYPTPQKARQHFVSCHIDERCWACPISNCPDPRKYKRLDDLKHHHMVPYHKVDYTRSTARGMALRPGRASIVAQRDSSSNIAGAVAPDDGHTPNSSSRAMPPFPNTAGSPVPQANSVYRKHTVEHAGGLADEAHPSHVVSRTANSNPLAVWFNGRRHPRAEHTVGGSSAIPRQGVCTTLYSGTSSPSQPPDHGTTSLRTISPSEMQINALSPQTEPHHRSSWSTASSPYRNSALSGLSNSPFALDLTYRASSSTPPGPPFSAAAASLTRSPTYGRGQMLNSPLSPADYGRDVRPNMLAPHPLMQSPLMQSPPYSNVSGMASSPWTDDFSRQQGGAVSLRTQMRDGIPGDDPPAFQWFHSQDDPALNERAGRAASNLRSQHQPLPSSPSSYLTNPLRFSTSYHATQTPSNVPSNAAGISGYSSHSNPLTPQSQATYQEEDLGIFDAYSLDPNATPLTASFSRATNPGPQVTLSHYPYSHGMNGGW